MLPGMTAAAFRPVGSALPPRRDRMIEAKAAAPTESWDTSINVSRAQDRLWEYFEREQGPADVRSSLSGAMNGDIRLQHILFSAMLDTWPKLQKAINEMARRVVTQPWTVIPYAERGEQPDDGAQEMAGEMERMLWGMKPRVERNEAGLEGTIRNLVFGCYYGHGVQEIRWQKGKDAAWEPRCTKPVPSRFYGYPSQPTDDGDDRLQFYPSGQLYGSGAEDFPEHRFLIAVNAGHATHPAMSAPLRALAPYWLAAVYGLKWFMNFTQLYGIPWRHAEVADKTDEGSVKAALAAIGSTGYIVTKTGTKINVLDSAKSGDSIPQNVLIELADRQCNQFILGQTLTSGTDGSGSRALGDVHKDTLDEAVKGLADFVGGIITHQLIPAIAALNYGDKVTELPEFWARHEEAKDDKARAERMEILGRIGVPMSKAYVYEDLGVPIPEDDAELFRPLVNGAQGEPATGGGTPPHETKPPGGNDEDDDPEGDGKPPGKSDGEKVTAASAALCIIKAGGFRTLDDGRVIYIEKTETHSPGDKSADDYRKLGSSPKASADKAIDREAKPKAGATPSAAELRKPGDQGDPEKPKAPSAETIDLEKARKEYEQEQLEESMSGFPEIGKEMKGKLPRPEDLPAGDPLRGEVQNIWDRFKKETRNEDGKGRSVIAPSGAAQYFAPKGTKVNLDDLRQQMNEQGFDFQTPGDMLGAVYESLEGRKSWGTMSRGDLDVAAADAAEVARLAELMEQAQAAVDGDGLVNEDALAALMVAAWASGAKPTT
jgi:phage gp29-like protein